MHPLTSRICGLTLALGLVLACAHPVDAQKTLEGTWTATKAERDGKAADDVVGHRLSFAGDRFQRQIRLCGKVSGGRERDSRRQLTSTFGRRPEGEGVERDLCFRRRHSDHLRQCRGSGQGPARRFRGKEWVRVYPRHVQARLLTSGPAGKLAATEITLQGEVISGNGLRMTSLSSTSASVIA